MVNRPASAVEWARDFIMPALAEGSLAVDATAGKGNDTLFLASAVGEAGIVYSFDIQDMALDITAGRLRQAGLDGRVRLIKDSHSLLKKYIDRPVDAVMLNLGYLPGSDRTVVTDPVNTVQAIQAGLDLLSPGGRMSIVVYTGHPGAASEARAVAATVAALQDSFTALRMEFWNGPINSPHMYFITRAGESI